MLQGVMIMNFNDITQRLKDVLAEISNNEKLLDKDIALHLALSPSYFAVIKKRNKIPYQALAYFCKKHKINLNWILLAQKPIYLK